MHLPDGGIQAVGMPAQELDAVLLGRGIHGFALVDGQGHGLLDNDVLAVLRRDDAVARVEFMWRGHVDGVHVRALAQGLHAVIRLSAEFFPKPMEGRVAEVRCSRHLDQRKGRDVRQHTGGRLAQTGKTQSQHLAHEAPPSVPPPLDDSFAVTSVFTYSFHGMELGTRSSQVTSAK